MALNITGDAPADALLTDDPFALLVGMLLDQQVPMETAFAGPAKIRDRMGGFDPETVAAADPEAFAAVFKESPAVHRFPGSMAGRVQALAAEVRDEWGGHADAIWTRPGIDGLAPDGAEILRRLQELPGFGEQKASTGWVRACDRFFYCDLLLKEEKGGGDAKALEKPKARVPVDDILVAIEDLSDEDGWAYLGPVGQMLTKRLPDFDPRNHGFRKLSDLVASLKAVEMKREKGGGPVQIRARIT